MATPEREATFDRAFWLEVIRLTAPEPLDAGEAAAAEREEELFTSLHLRMEVRPALSLALR